MGSTDAYPMAEQDSDYPGTPSDHDSGSSSSGVDRLARMEFQLRFLNGTSISLIADYIHLVGWVRVRAAKHLGVRLSFIRIFRGTTPLPRPEAKVFDVLGGTNELSAIVLEPMS